ncbi:hypothetical protein T492DRAFT_51196 [Pavlovales sp. CCMP2436]|nr:hypothetical protein T492DRAFT_51196 [Pavlovales sp. CCMP2436]
MSKRGISLLALGAQLASASRAFSARAVSSARVAPLRSARWGAKAAIGFGVAVGAAAASAEHAEGKIAFWERRQGEHSWLEEVLGEKALEWVKTQNAKTVAFLGDPTGTPLYERVLTILTSKDKIPYVRKIGDKYYNFWQDKESKRGVLRRTTLESYRTGAPEWEVVISVDALCEAEGESWVYKGSALLDEGSEVQPTRTLIYLSRGGADATVTREFDLEELRFILPSEGGFVLPEAKSSVSWQSRDVLLIGTDFGPGSLTESGYPRTVREWTRGTPLESAVLVYEGEATDVAARGYVSRHGDFRYEWRTRSPSFYTSKKELRSRGADGSAGAWLSLDGSVPEDATVQQFRDQFLIKLRSAWRGHAAGSLLAVRISDIAWGPGGRSLEQVLFVIKVLLTPPHLQPLSGA